MKPKRSLSVVGLCFFLMLGLSWEVGAFSEEDLEKLEATGSCVKCDLSGVNLSGAGLTEANLEGANLTRAIFCETIMPDAAMNNSGC